MCELFCMSSHLPTDVNLSLSTLARRGGLEGPHRDGWGVAFYQEREAWVIKEAQAAAESDCERFIEGHRFRSRQVISHIRLATRGGVRFENTQPFSRELGGRSHVFAHNGDLKGIGRQPGWKLGRFRPMGETDSEVAFCLLLDRLEPLWLSGDGVPALEGRRRVVEELAAMLRPLGPSNFIYGDGDGLFVHGHRRRQDGREGFYPPGLHVLCRRCAARDGEEVPGLSLASEDDAQDVFLAASVPVSDEEGWRPLDEGEVVVVRDGRIVVPDDL